MISIQELGDYTIADEDAFDIQTITESMMTTAQSMTELAIKFFLNLVICWIIVRLFYYPKSRRRDYFFTFMVFSTAMLMLLYVMGNAEVGIGLTLGLFAIFGVIRYRTETVPIREMTYLFVIIALAAMNGLAPIYKSVGAVTDHPHYELSSTALTLTVISNLLIVALIAILESERMVRHTSTKLVLYDRIDMIVPERREELMADLEKRTGIKIDKLEIGHIDFLKDAAFIKLYYTLEKGETATIGELVKAKKFVEQ